MIQWDVQNIRSIFTTHARVFLSTRTHYTSISDSLASKIKCVVYPHDLLVTYTPPIQLTSSTTVGKKGTLMTVASLVSTSRRLISLFFLLVGAEVASATAV